MKRVAIPLLLCLVVGLLFAAPLKAGEMAKPKTHDVKMEVVSVDAKAHTITVKDDKGATKTVPVMEAARPSLIMVKAGDHVMLTCMDNDKGEHQGVTSIKIMPAAKAG